MNVGHWGAPAPTQLLQPWGPTATRLLQPWGDVVAPPPPLESALTTLLPVVSTAIEASQDPYRQVEVLKAKRAKLKAKGASAYRIEKVEAKLRAAEQRLGIRQESLESTREWRGLGKIGAITGIGIGAALIFFIIVKALQKK